jgi:predicted dinucleotide-binding enzyme
LPNKFCERCPNCFESEEIAKLAPRAKVVEAIPPMASILASASHRLGGPQISTFYCGDGADGKKRVAQLLADLDLDPVDVGKRPALSPHWGEGGFRKRIFATG